MNLITIFCVYYRPANPGEEIVLHCGPMTDIATQIVEIFYPLSVAANIIIPGCDAVYNYNKIFNILTCKKKQNKGTYFIIIWFYLVNRIPVMPTQM